MGSLVVVYELLSRGMRTLSCSMHVRSSSLTRDRTRAPCIGSTESYPLCHQGSPAFYDFYYIAYLSVSQGSVPGPLRKRTNSGLRFTLLLSQCGIPCKVTCFLGGPFPLYPLLPHHFSVHLRRIRNTASVNSQSRNIWAKHCEERGRAMGKTPSLFNHGVHGPKGERRMKQKTCSL